MKDAYRPVLIRIIWNQQSCAISLYSLDTSICDCRKQKGLCLRSNEDARRGVAFQSVSTGVTAI